MAGGFDAEEVSQEDGPAPLPPWMADETDIRQSMKRQQDIEREINAADREVAEEEERKRRKAMQDRLVEIDSDSDSDSDIQIIEVPPSPESVKERTPQPVSEDTTESAVAHPNTDNTEASTTDTVTEATEALQDRDIATTSLAKGGGEGDSPEPEFEDVEFHEASNAEAQAGSLEIHVGNEAMQSESGANGGQATVDNDEDLFAGIEQEEEFSDPEDEELLAQMAEEAEEHARFASELNQKSAQQNREDYEKELRALRGQQKKDRRDADEVTQVMITECQSLLRLFGIPYITAPMEAEAQCAELVRLGIVDGIVTDDSDTFLFGGTRVYKNMFNSNKFVECYLGVDLDKELSLSRQQLISMAHLLGSDYTEGLPGVGPVTAVEIISEFPGKSGLADFREWWTQVQAQSRSKEDDAHSPFRKKFRKSQGTKLFLPPGFPNLAVDEAYLQPEVDSDAEPFQWGVPDLEGLRQFLMATIGWSKERTDEVLVPVIRDMNKRGVEGTQSNITRFFGGGVGAGARAPQQKEGFAPKQKTKSSKRMAAAVDRLKANVAGEAGSEAEPESRKRRRTGRQDIVEIDD